MPTSKLRCPAAGLLLLIMTVTVPAQPAAPRAPEPLALETRLDRLIVSDEGSRLEPATLEDLAAGSEVIVTITFTNVAGQPLHDVRISVPIPSPLRYVEGTAVAPGAVALYSVDGGLRYAPPDELTVSDGEGAQRPAAARDYTHVRWLLRQPLDADAQGTARFRAVVRDPV